MSDVEMPGGQNPLDDARDATQAIVDMLGDRLPARFWDDAFVLGFVYFAVHAYALQAGAGEDDLKNLPTAYDGLLGEDAAAAIARSAVLHQNMDPSFILGLENADKFIAAMRGTSKYDEDEAVIRAHEQAREAVATAAKEHRLSFDEALYIYLHDELFAGEVRRRFPEMSETLN